MKKLFGGISAALFAVTLSACSSPSDESAPVAQDMATESSVAEGYIGMQLAYLHLPNRTETQPVVSITPTGGAQRYLTEVMLSDSAPGGATAMTTFLERYPLPEAVAKYGISLEGISSSHVAGSERVYTLEFERAEPTETRLHGFAIESALAVVGDMMQGLSHGARVAIIPDAEGQREIEQLIADHPEATEQTIATFLIQQERYVNVWPEGWQVTTVAINPQGTLQKFSLQLVYLP